MYGDMSLGIGLGVQRSMIGRAAFCSGVKLTNGIDIFNGVEGLEYGVNLIGDGILA